MHRVATLGLQHCVACVYTCTCTHELAHLLTSLMCLHTLAHSSALETFPPSKVVELSIATFSPS